MWFDNWQGIARVVVVIGLSAYAALIALLLAGIGLPFPTQQIFFRDHTDMVCRPAPTYKTGDNANSERADVVQPRPTVRLSVSTLTIQQGVHPMNEEFAECMELCSDCANQCNQCAAACLQEDDVKMMARCIALDMDCAAACAFAAAAMARGSEHAAAICALCAEICQACGEECQQHDMDHCQQCAAICLACADECRSMAAAA
ncbi:four-helix bundle copper-binding protein [Polaromonas sp. CG_9.7]|uniref:four-helix bundle copper-binding protein n=2 Tax=Polaromonas TaxID=52972 RepID=UPI001A2FC26B|nr:hypothetical protein [Polaromonas sp. CG_9.7]MBG6112329.1 hypothetical protein [Polaromonas sp. CG_9.2]MDH6183975.1 hypothetical protein [Polaromonas sp. CG_23.6]